MLGRAADAFSRLGAAQLIKIIRFLGVRAQCMLGERNKMHDSLTQRATTGMRIVGGVSRKFAFCSLQALVESEAVHVTLFRDRCAYASLVRQVLSASMFSGKKCWRTV